MKNEKITARSEDFAAWYTDVVKAAHLADYSSVKGCVIFEANGYALWEKIQQELDKMFKKTGHQNVYMPVFIPESLLRKEGELIEGFAPDCAWITEGGNNKLEESKKDFSKKKGYLNYDQRDYSNFDWDSLYANLRK